MNLSIHPVTIDRWPSFERLIESKGGPHNCWCMAWRNNENQQQLGGKAGKKASIHQRVKEEIPIGLLAYVNEDPVGWCSIAPRDTHKSLGGDATLDNVWSITCFFVRRDYRGAGLAYRLISAAVDYARENGGQHVEAYPVAPDSPSYRFMGFVSMFKSAGFRFVKKAGTRRNVMVLDCVQK